MRVSSSPSLSSYELTPSLSSMTMAPSVSALQAFSTGTQVIANNIANINTHDFKASVTRYETGPMDQGVSISEIRKDGSRGAYVAAPVFTEEAGRTNQRMGFIETSNTDVAREFSNMISTQRGFEANTASIVTTDEMMGTLLNIKI